MTPPDDCDGSLDGAGGRASSSVANGRGPGVRREAPESDRGGWHRALLHAMDHGYCLLEMISDADDTFVDYRFLETNPAFERHTGLVDAVGRTALELVPDLETRWIELYGRVARTGEPDRFQQGSEAMGRWFDVYASPAGDPADGRVALLFTDVSAQREAEAALRQSEQRYRDLFQQAPAFIAVLRGPEHRFEFVNPAYLRLVGDRDLIGKPIREALPEVAGQGFVDLLDRVYSEGETFIAADRSVELQRVQGGTAERRYGDFVYEPLRTPDGTVDGVIAFGVDTTDRVRTREALSRTNEKLERANRELERANRELEQRVDARTAQVRELARALTLAEQGERRRIAHVLHEDLQQVLVGARMLASAGESDRLMASLGRAADVARTLSHELAPPLLRGEELADLIGWLAERERSLHGLEVDVEVRGAPTLEEHLRVLLYGLLREALFNVVKHAGVGRARITAERGAEAVRITVEDEGTGFDPSTIPSAGASGFGLQGARERLELVGGRLTVDTAPGAGTRVVVEFPSSTEAGG